MRKLTAMLLVPMVMLAACSPAAPATPTSPPAVAPTVAPAASPAAKPSAAASPSTIPSPVSVASPAASPVAAAKPAVSPVASPSAAAAVASPSAGPPVSTALLFSGTPTPNFTLTSSAFTAGGSLGPQVVIPPGGGLVMPDQYTCTDPNGGTPPLSWSGAPSTTQTFALVLQDTDTGATPFTHWVVYNIPSSVTVLDANQPADPTLPDGAMQGQNGGRTIGYRLPCPPVGSAPHHYTFQLFALDSTLTLQPGASIVDLQTAMTGHMTGQTELIALFGR